LHFLAVVGWGYGDKDEPPAGSTDNQIPIFDISFPAVITMAIG
jgi:hypothetical protein